MVDEGGEFIARQRKSLSLAFTMRTEEGLVLKAAAEGDGWLMYGVRTSGECGER